MLETYNPTDLTLQRKYLQRFQRVVILQIIPGFFNEEGAKHYFDYAVYAEENNRWLLKPIAYEHANQQLIMIYEDFAGQPLPYLIQKGIPVNQFLYIAIELVNALISLHQKGLLIGHLNPRNILIHSTSLQIKLVSASMLTKWNANTENAVELAVSTEELPYIAPEHTGRLPIEVDERSDLYVLGVLFYEMISKKRLFNADNSVDCIFDILTKKPDFTHFEKENDLKILKMIVERLLEKNPDNRYQSAVGLKKDLKRVRQQLADGVNEILFPLGQDDKNLQPKPSTKLYGRDDEKAILSRTFARVQAGEKQIVFINGTSGCGKSALALELQNDVAMTKGYFVSSKYDQLPNQETFSPIIQPLRRLLKQVYVEGEGAIVQFQKGLQGADFMITESLLSLIPELKWFLSDNTELLKENYHYTLQLNAYIFASIKKILAIFSRQRIPIVWVIDDLQWANAITVDIIKQIYEQHQGGYFLLVITVRNDEASMLEPITEWQQELESFCAVYPHYLSPQDVSEWLEDSLKAKSPFISDAAQRLYHITQGNALFMNEVFRVLLNSRALYFDAGENIWKFDGQRVQNTIFNQELLGFISNRIEMLSPKAQSILQVASCFGREFELKLLLKLVELPPYELIDQLEEMIQQGFIIARDHHFKWKNSVAFEDGLQLAEVKFQFVHDRIQETAYEALSQKKREEIHYKIGQLLIGIDEHIEESDYLQEIVRQFNYCNGRLSLAENQQLAIWNYTLGVRLKNAGLFKNALQFFVASLKLLPSNHWVSMRETALEIYTSLGECEYLVGDYQDSKKHIEEALEHTETVLEKLIIYRLMTLIYIESESSELVINAGFAAFELCGMSISREPTKLQVLKEVLLLKWELKNVSDQKLFNLPAIDEQEMDVLIQIMIYIVTGTYRMNPNLTGMLILRVFRLQLKYGATAESAMVYMNYTLILISGFNDIKQAMRFGKLAMSLADNQSTMIIKARIYFTYGIFLNHWEEDYESSIRIMRLTQQYCEQVGLKYQVTVTSCFLCATRLANGASLKELDEELQYQQDRYAEIPHILSSDYLTEFQSWISALRNPDTMPDWDSHITLKDEEMVVGMHSILRLQMAYLLQNEQQAALILENISTSIDTMTSLPTAPSYYFYRALWQFDFLKQPRKHREKRRQYVTEINESVRKFKKWAKVAPHIYEHLYMLLLAENCRMKKLDGEALLYFDRAIQLAKVNKFPQDVAIIYERAAKYYEGFKDIPKTSDYITRGIKEMRRWGAETIARKWEVLYGEYVQIQLQKQEYALSFDMITVLEATQSLAKEVRMEDLLQKLLFSLLKQANATSGFFIRFQHGRLHVQAMAQAEDMQFKYYNPPVELVSHIKMIAELTLQSNEPVIISNTQKSPLFSHIKMDTKSILCLPVHHKGEVKALLYLDNALLQNAFNSTQVELLTMISTQIAVSIENAEIYQDLEQRVENRTKELGEINLHLKEANEKLEMNELERKKLLHSISHELRSPITSSLGYIEAILDGLVTTEEEQHHYLMRSKDRLLSLNLLIQDLFDLAKLEAGRLEYSYSKVAVQDFYEQLAISYGEDVQRANLTYKTDGHFEQETYILIDINRVKQVVTNMIMNAIKYTKHGEISFRMMTTDEDLICVVEDSGIGIPEQEIQFIFDSYYSASNIKNSDSHGIGLAICKKIIEQHHGKISVESIEKQGSRFSFKLPLMKEME
ncbi:ATP-binding protein [Lysinibacillus sp. 54212]|uniref:ATP-binding protein n=1 Tax=Lysinibacillus sp. 54212 TaxID=3119829 RepID=UPI002FC774BD